mgnify:CR=1 FL=1
MANGKTDAERIWMTGRGKSVGLSEKSGRLKNIG